MTGLRSIPGKGWCQPEASFRKFNFMMHIIDVHDSDQERFPCPDTQEEGTPSNTQILAQKMYFFCGCGCLTVNTLIQRSDGRKQFFLSCSCTKLLPQKRLKQHNKSSHIDSWSRQVPWTDTIWFECTSVCVYIWSKSCQMFTLINPLMDFWFLTINVICLLIIVFDEGCPCGHQGLHTFVWTPSVHTVHTAEESEQQSVTLEMPKDDHCRGG